MAHPIFMPIAVFILIVCAGFFSGAEAGITAVSRAEFRAVKKQKKKSFRRLARLIESKDTVITTLLITNSFVHNLLSGLVTAFTVNVFGSDYLTLATIIITTVIILFAEILPKVIATQNPVGFSRAAGGVLHVLHIVLRPAVWLASSITSQGINYARKRSTNHDERFNEKNLQVLISISMQDGAVKTGEQALLNRAVHVHTLNARSIMTPRTQITAVSVHRSIEAAVNLFRDTGLSRLPVFDKTHDNIVGVLHYKDVLFFHHSFPNKQMRIQAIMQPPLFVPETASVFTILKAMNINKKNMALIVDEYGGIAGLTTMTNTIASVFGAAADDYNLINDDPMQFVKVLSSGRLRIPGSLDIAQFNELMDTNCNSRYYDTVAGLLLEHVQHLPKEGERVTIKNIEFTVKKIVNRKIDIIEAAVLSTM